jgi:hypothetical protein
MAATVFALFPKQRWLSCVAISCALYVGLGVSMTIHWFSDFVAGAILGTVIGVALGEAFFSTRPLALNRSRLTGTSQGSLGGGLRDLLLPELFGLPVVLWHFLPLTRIIQLDLPHSFAHPIQEEL